MRRRHVGGKGNLAFLAGCQADGDDLVAAQGSDGLALVLYTVYLVAHHAPGIVQVEPALIGGIVGMTGHGDIQVAEGLIGHAHVLARTDGHHLLVGQLLRLLVLALKDELAHLGQGLLGMGVHHLVGLSGPDGLFVQLDVLDGRSAEHHAAHDTVAHRQGLCPRHGRPVVPQPIFLSCHRDDSH